MVVTVLVALLTACGPAAAPPDLGQGPAARFAVPTSVAALDGEHWFEHPWPSDFRRDGSGKVRFEGYPNPHASKVIAGWVDVLGSEAEGFSPVAAGYLSFDAPIDPATLPDATSSVFPSSGLQLVDVDPASLTVGTRLPLEWSFRADAGDYFFAPNTLAFAPALGTAMRHGGRYAVVATRELTGPSGPARPSDDLAALLRGEGPLATSWGAALDILAKAGVPRERIAHLAVFTVDDPTRGMLKLAEHSRALPLPKVTSLVLVSTTDPAYDEYQGSYEGAPDYQVGVPPFLMGGGGIAFDAEGEPVVQRVLSQRFELLVPKANACPPPADGYPFALYAHGTGGDWKSLVTSGTGPALASKCIASMGVDQLFHGVRPGAPAESDPNAESKAGLSFFNVANASAIRHNNQQAAVDEVMRARLVASGALTIDASVSATTQPIAFDPKRLAFYGHSQGTFNGAVFLAHDENLVRGAVLSGSCSSLAHWTMLRVNVTPSVPNLLNVLLAVPPDFRDELGPHHPALSLLQTVADPSDPIHAYPWITRAPLDGHAPKSVLMTEGVAPDGTGDNYVPPPIIEGNAIAGGYPLLAPVVRDIPVLTGALGVPVAMPPLSGNLAAGKASGGLAQFVPPAELDGHYVARQGKALAMTMSFLESVLAAPVPTIPAP
jgi:predicted esterase